MVSSRLPVALRTYSGMIFLMLNPEDVGGKAERVLFLDDMEWRHAEFLRVLGTREDVEVHRAWTAEQAISLLRERRFDRVFLDHDLSDSDIMCGVGEQTHAPTGMDVVDHILSMEDPPRSAVVHSCNAPAAAVMHVRLEGHPAGIRVTRCPFPFLLQALR